MNVKEWYSMALPALFRGNNRLIYMVHTLSETDFTNSVDTNQESLCQAVPTAEQRKTLTRSLIQLSISPLSITRGSQTPLPVCKTEAEVENYSTNIFIVDLEVKRSFS